VEPLAAIDGWDVPTAAVAALTAEGGVVATRGPTDQRFAIASVTKLLVAYACLIAVEEGTLELDLPAGPEGSTVRHLLSHASGLPFEGVEPIAPPGRRRTYSNTGFEVLGRVLAERSGLPVGEYLNEAVLAPLHMSSTDVMGGASNGSPAKDGWSTVVDLASFAVELLHPTLVAPETFEAATSVAFPGLAGILPGLGRYDPCDWGLGFELRDGKVPHWTGTRCAPETFGHFGGAGTFVWVDPTVGVGLVCLTDREFGPWALEAWPLLSDAVLADRGDRNFP
jgi:CubicO group peptidase (beta-lactamase class C family)